MQKPSNGKERFFQFLFDETEWLADLFQNLTKKLCFFHDRKYFSETVDVKGFRTRLYLLRKSIINQNG